MAETREEYATIIGADAKFKGELQFESGAKVLGSFEGSINSKGKIFVANGSDCKATICAKEVSVEGRINGNVEAVDRIELKPTGVVTGDIVAARMTMAEGASINGHCHIGPNGKAGTNGKPTASTEAKPQATNKTVSPQPAKSR